MDFSKETSNGLKILGDTSVFSDSAFASFLSKCTNDLLVSSETEKAAPELSSVRQGPLKQAHAALLTFLLESARQDADIETLRHTLEDCQIAQERIESILNTYQKIKADLEVLLSSTSHGPPHIVDVSWTLQQSIKTSTTGRAHQPEYLIKLKTEQIGESSPGAVQFCCTQEQLQDLVGKLKDACKSLERIAQQQ